MNLELYLPRLEDLWYEQKLQSDPNTMSYNAGYDVSYYGYHYDTGCIDFPKERWDKVYNRRKKQNMYFAYIKDNDINEYVGYVNYHYNKNDDKYDCGILIEDKYRGRGYAKEGLKLLCNAAKENKIEALYDNFEVDRDNGKTLSLFKSVGFKEVEYNMLNRYNKEIKGVIVKIEL